MATKFNKIIIVLCVLLVCVYAGVAGRQAHRESGYKVVAQVVEYDAENWTVVVQDYTGKLWKCVSATEWEKYNAVDVLVNDKGTPDRTDDEAVAVARSAWPLTHTERGATHTQAHTETEREAQHTQRDNEQGTTAKSTSNRQ